MMTEDREAAFVLRQARDLIADRRRWTSGAFARTLDGNNVDANDDAACEWCVAGAVCNVIGLPDDWAATTDYVPGIDELVRAAREMGGFVANINDRGHAQALELIDRAIALAEVAA